MRSTARPCFRINEIHLGYLRNAVETQGMLPLFDSFLLWVCVFRHPSKVTGKKLAVICRHCSKNGGAVLDMAYLLCINFPLCVVYTVGCCAY